MSNGKAITEIPVSLLETSQSVKTRVIQRAALTKTKDVEAKSRSEKTGGSHERMTTVPSDRWKSDARVAKAQRRMKRSMKAIKESA